MKEDWFVKTFSKAGFLYNHFQSMYYQIAVLLLFYRGALLNFSDRSEKLSKRLHEISRTDTKGLRKTLEQVEALHKDFLLFRNRYWFREVTAQDQGIEMFDLWSRKLRNQELMKDVEEEIKELFSYVNSLHEKNISNTNTILTIIGSILIPIALLTGLLGMNLDIINKPDSPYYIPKFIAKILNQLGIFINSNAVDLVAFVIMFFMSFLTGIVIYQVAKRWKT